MRFAAIGLGIIGLVVVVLAWACIRAGKGIQEVDR